MGAQFWFQVSGFSEDRFQLHLPVVVLKPETRQSILQYSITPVLQALCLTIDCCKQGIFTRLLTIY
jgi:hypothetical protein